MKILLVEDDSILGDGIRAGLKQAGYVTDWVTDGNAADLALKTGIYEAMILDLNLPKKSGLEVLAECRARKNPIPVLILTARDTLSDKIKGLDSGADDYLIKPFDLDELLARIRALVRRSSGQSSPIIQRGNLTLDPAAHSVTLDQQTVAISAKEFNILEQLLLNQGRVFSREQLEEKLYGWDDEIESNSVEVHIHHLRKKLGNDLIRTIRGIGYVIDK
ncbi:MAG: winged helix-turn-helix domain-containing protein [Betaproteobacteria bacterium]|nr:winged helix-turn-helix domain-containing protein [Betaproteobacteria bacterium]MDE2423482.1 winged helix-turn-helix domain-containing protein [Betaproteobacteria bacterium]